MSEKNNKQQKKKRVPKSRVVTIVLCIIFVAILALGISKYVSGKTDYTPREVFCYDYKQLLTDEQEQEINSKAKKIQSQTTLTILVITCDRISLSDDISSHYYYQHNADYDKYGYRAEYTRDSFFAENGISDSENYVLLIINAIDYNVDYHFDIYGSGKAISRIDEDERHTMLYSKAGDMILESDSEKMFLASMDLLGQIKTAYNFALHESPMGFYAIAIIISAVITLIVALVIKKSYSRKRSNATFSFETNSNTNITKSEDVYRNSVTTSVVIVDSSSRGSGGGRSSGGGGGGGGGGHFGGR